MAEINLACNCNDQYDVNLDIPETKPNSDPEIQVLDLNFGKVRVGREKTLKVKISNDDNKQKYYYIRRNAPPVVSIYDYFQISHNSFLLDHGNSTTIKITYKPLINNTINYDCIIIADSFCNELKLIATGISVGPEIHISADFLTFNTSPEHKTGKKAIEICNISEFPVQFTFDIDDKPMPIFEVVPSAGIIEGRKHLIIHVTFRAVKFGEYSQRFFCMIHNHRPLIVECFGVYWKSKEDQVNKRYTRHSEVIENNFMRYMRDVQVILNEMPAFSFIDTYLNFGTVDITMEKDSTLVTSLTNHRNQAVIIKWFQDEYFKVTPATIEVPSNESILFECTFRPSIPDNIYSRNLLLNVFCTKNVPDEDTIMPTPAVLRVLGHSFSERNLWIPQFEINPSLVILPPALPGQNCFTTIELKSAGYLATSFKFISPTASHFLVKPMMGTVRGLTIVVVQMLSDKVLKPKLYVEQWFVLLNNDKNHKIPICLKGYSELPSISIGEDNTITLKGVQVGCKETVSVPFRNICQHLVYYEFVDFELTDGVSISEPKGSLPPNATLMVDVSYQSESRMCKQLQVTCLVYAMHTLHEIYGSPADIPITIYIESDYSDLCSMPSHHDFATIQCQSTQSTEFRLFNYGTTTIHFKLSLWDKYQEHEFENATIEPIFGTLEPKAHADCSIFFIPIKKEKIEVNVYYELCAGYNDTNTLTNTFKLIFQFQANIIYSYFQIMEIADHNFGPLFSKRTLWDFLNINWLNYALSEANINETTYIDLNLPDAQLNTEDFYVLLMVKNVTQFPVQVSLKRRKLCDCELQEVDKFVSIRKKVYQCPHRQMFKLAMMEETILPHNIQNMKMQINYSHQGQTKLSYSLMVGGNRKIIMNFNLYAIDVDEEWLSKYNSTFSMSFRPVCFREKQPKLHVFWFYNNTNSPTTYRLVEDEFEAINKKYSFDIFKCLNPRGEIDEFAALPLFIKFNPIEKKHYQLILPLLFGESRKAMLHLNARGSKHVFAYKKKKQTPPSAISPNVPIHLSFDRVKFPPFPVWKSETRMIFITNTSEDIIGYNWIKTTVDGICEVDIFEPNGVLRPQQTNTIIIQVKTFGHPCSTRVHLPCELINHSKYLQHKKSVIDYATRQKEIKDEFIITEAGVSFPINEIQILPKPRCFYVTLAIELEITSYVDRDMHHTPEEQFTHSPPKILNSSEGFVIEPVVSALSKPIHPIAPTPSSSSDDDLYVEKSDAIDPKVDNVDFFCEVIEALLADAVFSNVFHKVMDVQKNASPKYYTQIRPRDGTPPIDIRQEINNMNNEPQMSFVKDVIHDMLLKSMEDIFKIKTKAHLEDIDYEREVDLPNVCQCKEFSMDSG